jgi:uncharacterized protein (TIGR04222 family)
MNILNLPGPYFLVIYVALVMGALVLSHLLKLHFFRRMKASFVRPQLSVYETAFLVGGRTRAVEAALTALAYRQNIMRSEDGKAFAADQPLPADADPLEGEIFCAIQSGPTKVHELHDMHFSVLQSIEFKLNDTGCMMTESSPHYKILMRSATWPLMAVIFIGVTKLIVGLTRFAPIGFLVVLLIISFAILIFCQNWLPEKTQNGEALVLDTIQRNAALKTTALQRSSSYLTGTDLTWAVALFGVGVSSGAVLWMQHLITAPRPTSSSGSSGGDGGSDGGSCGGGGGGCGGCGGVGGD